MIQKTLRRIIAFRGSFKGSQQVERDYMGKKRKKEELPDYTVANMDVEGMPWNTRKPWQKGFRDTGPWVQKSGETIGEDAGEHRPAKQEQESYSKKESMQITWMALKVALAISGVFALVAFLFILFCVYVWF